MAAAEEDYPKLDTDVDISLKDLDFDQIRQERFDRNRHFLESVNPIVAAKVFPGHEHEGKQLSKAALAAITIQRFWRGYKGREVYIAALWEQFEKEEEKQHEKMKYQMEEGELLIENHQLEVLLDDGKTTRRNAERRYLSKVITIQRAWRSYLEKPASERSRRETRYHGDQDTLRSNRVKVSRSNPFGNFADDDEEGENIETESSESFLFNSLTENEKSSPNKANKSPLINNFFRSGTSKNKEENLNISELSPKQQRKHSLLSKAHEFAELKKLDSKVLPFDLHLHLAESESSESQSAATKGGNMSTNMPPSVKSDQNGVTSPVDNVQRGFKDTTKDYSDLSVNANSKGDNCVEVVNKHHVKGGNPFVDTNSGADNSLCCDKDNNSESQNVCDKKGDIYSGKKSNCDIKGDNSCHTTEKQKSDSYTKGSNSGKKDIVESAFDVYNIETTLPDMDWSSLEQKLKEASEEARLIQEVG